MLQRPCKSTTHFFVAFASHQKSYKNVLLRIVVGRSLCVGWWTWVCHPEHHGISLLTCVSYVHYHRSKTYFPFLESLNLAAAFPRMLVGNLTSVGDQLGEDFVTFRDVCREIKEANKTCIGYDLQCELCTIMRHGIIAAFAEWHYDTSIVILTAEHCTYNLFGKEI